MSLTNLIQLLTASASNSKNLKKLRKVNLSDFKKLENLWKREIEAKNKVSVKIDIEYLNNETRPNKFIIEYNINDSANPKFVTIQN